MNTKSGQKQSKTEQDEGLSMGPNQAHY